MPVYKAPLHDIRFLMNEVFDYPAHYKTLSNGDFNIVYHISELKQNYVLIRITLSSCGLSITQFSTYRLR
jgi:hypothetical protein